MALADLSKLDKMIEEQKQRMEDRPENTQTQTGQMPMGEFPWTMKMKEAFEENIMKSEKCRACNWMNMGQKVVLMNRIQVMRENIPIISIICRQCGTQFVPKWCRKIMLQAIEKENQIMKARSVDQATRDKTMATAQEALRKAKEE